MDDELPDGYYYPGVFATGSGVSYCILKKCEYNISRKRQMISDQSICQK